MTVRTLETVIRRAGLALRPVDMCTGAPVVEGIVATAWPEADPDARTLGNESTGAGIIGFRSLPGLKAFEDGSTSRQDWFGGAPTHLPLPFTVRIVDRRGRYLPVIRTLLVPADRPVDIALPPAPLATAPAGLGLVVGQVVRDGDGAPAAWALLRATVGATVAGGVSDGRGMFAVFVPLATPPDGGGGPASPLTWTVSISVRYRAADQVRAQGSEPDEPPTFQSIAGQAAAKVDDQGAMADQLHRLLTRSGPCVASSAAHPPPSVLLVHPTP